MYATQSLHNILFLMFYGGVTMLALVAGIYLWLRRSNAIISDVTPPRALRRWTAAFFIMASMSHVWWYVIGVYWLVDDRLVRNIVCIMLDHITLVPLVMALLLRMLQDRQRRIWPWFTTQLLVMGGAAVGIATHTELGLDLMHNCQVIIITIFVTYYIYALWQYSQWLKDNYADLDHKEVWQSLLFAVILFVIYQVYSTNPGNMLREFMSQFNTLIIIAFLVWRVETLQELAQLVQEEDLEDGSSDAVLEENSSLAVIGSLLKQYCENTQLYLQHDLSQQQLAAIIGTNRTYLSQYFTQQDITYNAYINRLRIDHFKRLYHEAVLDMRPFTALQLAHESGFKSYSTFATAFKLYNEQNVTQWIKLQETADSQNLQ